MYKSDELYLMTKLISPFIPEMEQKIVKKKKPKKRNLLEKKKKS